MVTCVLLVGTVKTTFQLFLSLALLAAPISAQLTRGTILGAVQDPSGAAISNATVTIANIATGAGRSTTSNSDGFYRLPGVDPGLYSVLFAASGFADARINRLEVTTSQEVTLNQQLSIGSTATTVDVQDSPQGVELSKTTATVERTLSQAFIANAPASAQNRDVNQLALLAPTAVVGPGSSGISINGQRARNNNFLLDGIDNNDASVTISNNRVTPESTGEFQVQAQAFSAEFGRNSGGQIQVITRSGTNAFHGEVYEYWQGNSLTPVTLANKRSGFTSTPRFTLNEPGASFGGPVLRNKLFFFANAETDRQAQGAAPSTTSSTIPTAAGFAQLSSVPLGPGETAAARAAVLKSIGFLSGVYAQNPVFFNQKNVTVNGTAIPFGTVQIPIASPYVFWLGTARLDFIASARDSFYLRSSVDRRDQANVASNLGFGTLFSGSQAISRQNHVISGTHVFTPNLTNQVSVAFIRSILGFPENDPTSPSTTIIGAFSIGGAANFPQGRTTNEFQILDTGSYVLGRNTLKFGVNITRQRLFNQAAFDSKGTYSFNNFSDFLNSQAASLTLALNTASFDARQIQQSFFFQDDLKASKNLTFNLGLRYERAGAPFGFFGATDSVTLRALVPGPAKTDTNNWAPRAGVAYSPSFHGGLLGKMFGDGATVLRGGYGIAYDFLFYNILTVNASNYPRVVSLTTTGVEVQNQFPNLVRGSAAVFDPKATFVNSPTNLQSPTNHFYSASIQRQFGHDYIFEIGYTGNRSYHGIGQEQANPSVLTQAQADTVNTTKNQNGIPSTLNRRIYPFGSRILISSNATGNYNGLYVKLDKKLSHNLLVGFNYTYSKNLSDNDESLGIGAITAGSPQIPQDFSDRRSEYGLSAFDRQNRYVAFFNYEIPWFHGSGFLGNGIVKRVFSGWGVNGITQAQSGQPFTLLTGVDTYGVGSTAARPDYNPGGKITLDPVSHDYRTFKIPLDGTGIVTTHLGSSGLPLAYSQVKFGNLGRNTFRGPGLDTQNVTLFKKIGITERVNLEFRGEFFNLFNHRNFGIPVVNMSSVNFGLNLSNAGGREVLLSGRVRF